MAINWTKRWSASDDGTILYGADLGQLQSDIDNGVVTIPDAQTITGNKAFSGAVTFYNIPTLPASDPTSDNQAVRKAYVDTQDNTKLSKTTAGEINALTEKTTLSDNDIFLIEDSEASYAKKKVKSSLVSSWRTISRLSLTNATSITFSNLSPDKHYAIEYNLLQNTTDGYIYVRFNNDSGNNYWWSAYIVIHNGNSVGVGGSSTNAISIDISNYSTKVGYPRFGFFKFSTVPTNAVGAFLYGEFLHWRYDDYLETLFHGGRYAGSSSISSITIYVSAGSVTGKVYLLELKE